MARGRKPSGPKLVEGLQGSAQAKTRLHVVLQTMTGQLSVAQACALLGVGTARFHELRAEVLQAALDRLEPRPSGRPRQEPAVGEVTALEEEIRELRIDLQAARVREEIALAMPHLLKPGRPKQDAASKKTDNPE
jgi:hypothetical protein